MAWPVSPTNGQQVTIANVLYQYSSSLSAWSKVQLAQPPYISDGNNVTISGNLTIPGTMSAASFSVANIAVGNITASGTVVATGFTGPVTGNLTGTASNATFATLSATANTVAGANVTGQVPYAAIANSVSGANIVGQVNFAAVANSVAGANVSGAVSFATVANSVAAANVSGTVATATSATTAGTVTTAAQPNITSVGTLTSLVVTGNIDAGNLSVGTGTIRAFTITTGGNTVQGNITGNWALTTGSRLQATYADLAEYYRADKHYEPGTVLEFGGEFEVTLAEDETTRIAGVVSTNPAMAMNSACPGEAVAIALQGRVPCKVRGTIRKGDMLVSGGGGYARPATIPKLGTVIGKALQDYEGSNGIIEVVVGRL